MAPHRLLTSGEAADRLRMLRSRVVRLARAGEIPHIALPDGDVRFDTHDLDAWVDTCKHPSTSLGAPPDDE